MNKQESIDKVISFLNEITCSQSLGEDAADIMGIDENDLYETILVAINKLKED